MHLNPNQKKAVRTTEGRVLVLAGAGSGKTNVIIHRIAYLIKEKNVNPESILGMTFTNKAAEEMRSRIAKLVDNAGAQKLTLCTFHSFCMQILRAEIEHLGYTRSFSLYDDGDMKRLLKQLSRQILEHEGELPSMESTFQLIKEAKTRGEFVQTGNSWHESFAKRLWDSLENCLRAYNALDFDNLLSLTVKLFNDFPQVLEKYQRRFRYIMVDEYQDTNQVQYQLVTLLCGKHNHLCVVGDDDQAIYSWRGAEVEHILNFPYTELIKLEQNYRSTPVILKAAHMVIRENKKRHPKELWSDKSGGDQLRLFFAPTDEEEAKAVIDRIALLKEERGYKWKDCAILYRSNLLSRPFELALLQASWQDQGKWQRGIPYQIFGGTELYERSEIKDLFAYLRTIANPLDQEALLRIINFPRRGISLQTLELVTTENRKLRIPLWQLLKNIAPQKSPLSLTKQAEKGISSFVEFIERAQKIFSQMPLHKALKWCIHELHLEDALKEDTKSEKAINYKWQNILECVALAEEHQNVPLEDFISSTVLDQRNLPDSKKKNFFEDRVSLMTFHGAKGLEFKACFLVGIEDHLIPHEKSVQEGRIEEERRLFYVAMTRAKEYLSISTSKKRKRQGGELMTNPSRFLLTIPQDLIKVSQWKIPSI